MGNQDPMKPLEQAIEALWMFNLDDLKNAIREELMAEVRDDVRQEVIDEIKAELESAVTDAEDEGAPEIGTDQAWGQDDATGLRAFLTHFEATW